jgi:hypothetical protein
MLVDSIKFALVHRTVPEIGFDSPVSSDVLI